jgi:hypothetical protein
MHILGYGAKELVTGKDPEVVIQHIQAEGAISVIAHPKDDFFPWIRSFRTLPQGIEGWNSKYDGKHAPRPQTFQLVRELKERDAGIHAFYGQDLHWRNQFRELFVLVECGVPRPEQILRALSAGRFRGQKGNLELPSSGVLPAELLVRFGEAHTKSARMRQGLKQGKKILDRAGIKIPSGIKSQLRRIF